MPKSKIVNHDEVRRWIEEGLPYHWMVAEYLRKYNIETSVSMFGSYRARHGLARRIERDDDLIPWFVKEEHRYAMPALMLRAEARKRKGAELDPQTARKLPGWLEARRRKGEVVDYDPDTEAGWKYVPRREGIDLDLIREPERKTTVKLRAD